MISVFSCSEKDDKLNGNEEIKGDWKQLIYKSETKQLTTCLPDNWQIWEEYDTDKIKYLAHIGKGDFDLYIATKSPVNIQFILHFYPLSESTREAVQFTYEHAEIISSLNFADYFGETEKYLIYECGTEKININQIPLEYTDVKNCMKANLSSIQH